MIRKTTLSFTLGAMLALAAAAPAIAGQPNQSCEDQPMRPGQSSSAPGSAFNPDGTAGTHYAGEQPQNSKNPQSVSQYDVACAQVPRGSGGSSVSKTAPNGDALSAQFSITGPTAVTVSGASDGNPYTR